MLEAEFMSKFIKTTHVVVGKRVISCIADSLQKRRFASISSTDYKDTKASIFSSEFMGINVAHGRCG